MSNVEGRIANRVLTIQQSKFDIWDLPRLVLIADHFTDPERAERAMAAVRAGVRWVHLRDHQARPTHFERAAQQLTERLRDAAADVVVSVNTQLDVAASLGVQLHLGRRGPAMDPARQRLGGDALIGYSAHTLVEARDERLKEADYFFFSPVYPTPSKPDHPGVGLPDLASFCEATRPRPVLALGGITPKRTPDCRAAGAYGIAVLSGIMKASTPAAAARAYLRALAS